MASSVTYDGVGSAQGGNIFKDVKFWVAHRVPLRNEILQMITSNGGAVVPLEKNADFRIADRARKDAPAGSFSWQLIEDSVKNGAMQVEDKYRIGPDPDVPRRIAAGGVTKVGRTPFTHADDAALAKWVLSRQGSYSGNKIYMEFEPINPRHTWQSWRNRWEKNLKFRPQHELKMLAATAPEDPASQPESGGESNSTGVPHDVAQANDTHAGRQEALPASPKDDNYRDTRQQAQQNHNPTRIAHNQDQANREPAQTQARVVSPPPPRALPQSNREKAQEVSEPEDDDQNEMRDQFYRDLNDYVEEVGLGMDLAPRIQGRVVDLWRLSSARNEQEASVDEIVWSKVALDLGYTTVQAQKAANELEQLYENSLAGFLAMMEGFAELEEEGASTDGGETASAPASKSPTPQPVIPSSASGRSAGVKRSLDSDSLLSSGRKRRRRSSLTEVPTTPDEKLMVQRGNPFKQVESSSEKKKRMASREVEEDSQESQQLPLPPPAVERRLEPETQDFAYDQATQPAMLETQESSFEVTPSQQLQQEATDATPIPFRLDKASKYSDASPSAATTPRPAATTSEGQKIKPAPRRSLPASFTSSALPQATASPKSAALQQQSEQPSEEANIDNFQENQDNASALPRPQASTARAETGSHRNGKRDPIEECIEYYESLGYSHAHVVRALRSTTMTPGGQAAAVMQELRDGHGIPTNWEGVWIQRDDDGLCLVDSIDISMDASKTEDAQVKKARREWKRLVNKHGIRTEQDNVEDNGQEISLERIELRRKFLKAEEEARKATAEG